MRQESTTKQAESPADTRACPQSAERMSPAILGPAQATGLRHASAWQARLPLGHRSRAFTLAELVVTVGVSGSPGPSGNATSQERGNGRLHSATNKWTPTHKHGNCLIEWPSILWLESRPSPRARRRTF